MIAAALLSGALFSAAFFSSALAADWTVDVEGGGDFRAIPPAIASAADGDRVLVSAGTYYGGVDFMGKDLQVIGVDGAALTILDGQDADSEAVVTFVSGEPVTATLRGFTVRDGHGEPAIWNLGRGWNGAGVLIEGSAATLVELVIEGNNARHSGQSVGGGVAVIDGELRVRDTLFVNNMGYYAGGAIAVIDGVARVTGCRFEGNRAGRGGAIAALEAAEVSLEGNTFVGNSALYGGALYVSGGSRLTALGDTFEGHEAAFDGGLLWAMDAQLTLDGVSSTDALAGRDGGQLRLGYGSQTALYASALLSSSAQAGGAVFLRGEDATLTAEGLLLVDSSANDGADFWLADGQLEVQQLTSLRPSASGAGALLWAHRGAATLGQLIVSGGAGEALLYTGGEAELSVAYSLVYGFDGALVGGDAAFTPGLTADPLLVDPEASPPDVSLGEGSPAIDAGDPALSDLDGSRADLGATGGQRPWSP